MRFLRRYALAILALGACKSSDKATPTKGSSPGAAAAGSTATAANSDAETAAIPGPLIKDKRTQYDLAKAIKAAELKQDEDDRADGFFDIVDDWRGKQFQWTVYYLKAFCGSPEKCHVVPFDRGGKDKAIVQGWSPELKLTKTEWEKIPAGCPEDAPQCRITFVGTLASFTLSTQELTALRFDEVKIVGTDANM